MKPIIPIALFLTFFGLSCSTTSSSALESTAQGSSGDTTYVNTPQTLADVLIREPGVTVNAGRVAIRGQQYPLFVVDGVPVGRTYADAVSAVNVEDVRSVEILKSASETAIYGRRGANGVILIETR